MKLVKKDFKGGLELSFHQYKISLSYWPDGIYHTLIDIRFFAPLRMTDCLMSF